MNIHLPDIIKKHYLAFFKTKPIAVLLAMLTCVALEVRAGEESNIVLADRVVDCILSAKNGVVESARVNTIFKLEALRVVANGVLFQDYDDHSRIEKASSPGFKPVYKAAECGRMFYTGSRVCFLPFKVTPGKITTAQIDVSYPDVAFLSPIFLSDYDYPARQLTINVIVPAEVAWRVKVTPYNFGDNASLSQSTDAKGNKVYTVKAHDVKPVKIEEQAAPMLSTQPYLHINAAFADMSELYRYISSKLEDLSTVPADVAAQAMEITSGLDNDIDRIDAIARWVRQNIRYVGIEHGEFGLRPDSASEVLRKRFGDCKGSANLLAAMMRAVGIDGRRVWIGTRGRVIGSWSENPDLSAGNHMIAAAMLSDTTVFVDGTASYAPRGFIPYSIAEQECVIEDGSEYIITRVPPMHPASNLVGQRGRFHIDGNDLTGELTFTFGGIMHAAIEDAIATTSSSRRDQLLNRFLASGRKSISVADANLMPVAPDSPESTVSAIVTDHQGRRSIGKDGNSLVMPRPLRMHLYSTVEPAGRTQPIELGWPMDLETDIILDVPDGFSTTGLPAEIKIESPWFEGHISLK